MKSAGTVSISIALRSIVVAVCGVVAMFLTSPLLSALSLGCLPLLLVAFRVYANLNSRYTREGLTCSAQASVVAEESFGSIRTVRPAPAVASPFKDGDRFFHLRPSCWASAALGRRWPMLGPSASHCLPVSCPDSWTGWCFPNISIKILMATQVRSFAKEKPSCERYEGAQKAVLGWGLKSATASGFFFGFNAILAPATVSVVLWFGARQVRVLVCPWCPSGEPWPG